MRLSSQHKYDAARQTYEIVLPTNLDEERVKDFLRSIGSSQVHGVSRLLGVPTVAFETHYTAVGISHRIRVPQSWAEYLMSNLEAAMPGTDITPIEEPEELEFTSGIEIGLSDGARTIRISNTKAMVARLLGSVSTLEADEHVVVQWVISHSDRVKQTTKPTVGSSKFSILGALFLGNEARPPEVTDRKTKESEQNFTAVGRVGAVAATERRSNELTSRIIRALRSENDDNRFVARRLKNLDSINTATTPLLMGAQFTVSELAPVVAWPIGDPSIPGLVQGSNRRFPATEAIARVGRVLGHSNVKGRERPIALSYKWAAEHVFLGGRTGCLHPDTPIYDPVAKTTRTVKQRYDDGVPFDVFAMHEQHLVVARADAPIRFRKVGMYRLYNSEHSVVVTGQHRVWNGQAYVEVGKLFLSQATEPVRLPSISAFDLSRLQRDAQRSTRKELDSTGGYRPSLHSRDLRPLPAQGTYRASAPLLVDADVPCYQPHTGVQEHRLERIHPDPAFAHSSKRSSSHLASLCHAPLPLAREGTSLLGSRRDQSSSQSGVCYCPQSTGVSTPEYRPPSTCSQVVLSESELPPSCSNHSQHTGERRAARISGIDEPLDVPSLIFSEPSQGAVPCGDLLFNEYFKYDTFQVEQEEDETYYDFHVPRYLNYLATGLIHHNTGKSTLMANMAAQDMDKGYGVIVLDAAQSSSGETVYNRVLDLVPPERFKDVISINVTKDADFPVGFNPMNQGNADIVLGQLWGVFSALYSELDKGVAFRDVLANSVRTLKEAGDYTLADLAILIGPQTADEVKWSKQVIANVKDPEVKEFWSRERGTGERADDKWKTYTAPLMRRIGQLTGTPEVRNMISQGQSTIDFADILTNNKILLVSLNGLHPDTAALVGSLLMTSLWNTAQAVIPERENFLYLDEFQVTSKIPLGLDDLLARARKHKLGLTLATQYTEVLDRELKTAIVNNTATRILYATSHAETRIWESEFGRSYVANYDFTRTEKFHAIATIATDKGTSAPVTFKALKPMDSTGVAERALEHSRRTYGKPVDQVKRETAARRTDRTKPRSRPPVGWA